MCRLLLALASSAVVACGGSSPPSPPIVNPPAAAETINGTERLGWDQPAADAVELALIRYAIYVDGARGELTGVSCVASSGASRFSCSAPLPTLGGGVHTLQIASFVVDGSLLESARSAALTVNVTRAAPTSEPGAAARSADARIASASLPGVDLVASGFDMVVDIAVAPDGRLFVAEQTGRIHIVSEGGVAREPAISLDRVLNGGRLVALALDSQFLESHLVYVVYTARAVDVPTHRSAASDTGGGETFALARLRESGGTLGDPIILVDAVQASEHPSGALRFGADRKLYVAFDAGPDVRRADDPASLNGKLLRLNPDGTTPADQPRATPVVASGLSAPTGVAWQPLPGAPWIVDRRLEGAAQLRTLSGSTPTVYALPDDVNPTAIAVTPHSNGARPYDELLIGSEGRTHLLKVSIDPRTARPVKTERLLADGGSDVSDADRRENTVRALAVGPDGSVYIATPRTVGRLKD